MYDGIKTLSDLQGLIASEAQENTHLEFKASGSLAKDDKKKTEISKDVSAFANSDGGTIVYGMVEVSHKASHLDEGTSVVDKEWLENVITSNVSPRVDGLVIIPVVVTAGSYTYIVHIPKSSRAPHQAGDKKFYKRFNVTSQPMEQYEILDVMNREVAPDLSLDFAIDRHEGVAALPKGRGYELTVEVQNASNTPADYFSVTLYLSDKMQVLWPIGSFDGSGRDSATLRIEDVDIACMVFKRRWSITSDGPVWKGEPVKLLPQMVLDIPTEGVGGASYLVGYEISAPHMKPVRAYRAIHARPGYARISRQDTFAEDEIASELGL